MENPGAHLLNSLVDEISIRHKSFSIGYKDESLLQKTIGILVFPFNREYMTRYTTTLGSKVYFPSREAVEEDPYKYAEVLSHELVHIWDSEKSGLKFALGYASPQIWAVPLLAAVSVLGSWVPTALMFGLLFVAYLTMWALGKVFSNENVGRCAFLTVALAGVLSYFASSVMLSGWWTALAAAALIPMAPWPSAWRSKWEMRGYGMNLAFSHWMYGPTRDSVMEWI